MSSPETEAPVNPLPPVVIALFLVIIGIEAVFSLGARGLIGGPEAVGWRLSNIQSYAFSAQIFDWMLTNNQWPVEHLIRFVSYPFIHFSVTHALFAGVILLAMGKMVGEVLGAIPVLIIFFGASIVGAIAYGFVDTQIPLIGAYPPVYGLIGTFTYMLWLKLGMAGAPQTRAFTLIGFLLGIQLVFGVIFGSSYDWVADCAGFVTGFLLGLLLVNGGLARLLAKLRRD